MLDYLLRCSLGHDPAALFTSPRAKVDQPIRRQHCLGVVFNDQNGVAQISQIFESFNQPFQIPSVETN